jgi:hypothetical protein
MRRIPFLFALAGIALVSLSAHAQMVFTDGFSSTPDTTIYTTMTAGNFSTINNTNVDLIGNPGTYGYLCAATVAECVDLGGSGGNNPNGDLQSNTKFAAGTYLLNFYLSGTERGEDSITDVSFGSYSATLDETSSQVDDITVEATLTVPGYLDFQAIDAGDTGAVLDSVTVSKVGSTPEPSSLALLGSGLVASAGWLARRRKR